MATAIATTQQKGTAVNNDIQGEITMTKLRGETAVSAEMVSREPCVMFYEGYRVKVRQQYVPADEAMITYLNGPNMGGTARVKFAELTPETFDA